MKPLSEVELNHYQSLSNDIDYDCLELLFYLGRYRRELDIPMSRMMENALDWEHLPFLHHSSFSDLKAINFGSWGWRAQAELPPAGSNNTQVLQLLLDKQKHYWATTVLDGFAAGVQVHTQANTLNNDSGAPKIEVLVDFYFPAVINSNDTEKANLLAYMQKQYATLYDEDFDMMSARHNALQESVEQTKGSSKVNNTINLGPRKNLKLPYRFDLDGRPFCLREVEGEPIVHSAICPHLLGPLDGDCLEGDTLVCPWHGYRFDVNSGDCTNNPQLKLRSKATLSHDKQSDEINVSLLP